MIRTPKPICRHPLENKVTITLRFKLFYTFSLFIWIKSVENNMLPYFQTKTFKYIKNALEQTIFPFYNSPDMRNKSLKLIQQKSRFKFFRRVIWFSPKVEPSVSPQSPLSPGFSMMGVPGSSLQLHRIHISVYSPSLLMDSKHNMWILNKPYPKYLKGDASSTLGFPIAHFCNGMKGLIGSCKYLKHILNYIHSWQKIII